MSLDPETRKNIVLYRIEKAKATWDDAIFNIQGKRWNTASNRLYYALFHAASALLISEGILANTHKGFLLQISNHYVRTEILTKEEGKLIRNLFDLRNEDDYEDFTNLTEEDLKEYIPKAEALLNKLIALNKYT